jgi:hypothetical protein
MPEFTIDFEVFCDKCSAGLCNQSTTGEKHGVPRVHVALCESCEKSIRAEAYQEGYDAAYDTGHTEGYKKGYEEGCSVGQPNVLVNEEE